MKQDLNIIHRLQAMDLEAFLAEVEEFSREELALTDEGGQTLLHLAVSKNAIGPAAVLLSKGANPNQKNNAMLSPFIAAAANGLSDMFKLILTYEPDLYETNRFGGTALLPSSEKGFLRVVQQALDAGVPVNHVNRLGWSALLEAAILGDEGFLFRDIIEELLTFGADPDIQDFSGLSSKDYLNARNSSHLQLLEANKEADNPFSEIKQLIRGNQCHLANRKLLAMESSLEQIYYLGYSYECLGLYDDACHYYRKGTEEDPQFYYYLANLSKRRGYIKEVLDHFDQGAKLSANSDFYLYHKSNFLREIGQHPAALEIMDELLAQDSQRVDYMFHKMNSLQVLGEFKRAHEVALEADAIQPQNPLFSEQAEQILQRIV